MELERYRDVIPDWDRFVEAARRPEPTTLRVRSGRTEPERLARRLRSDGFELEPVDGAEGFFRVTDEPYPVSKTLEHWLGLFYIQQAVTGLAAPALEPRPGERVLDLCAAPGGKTTHLAELMEDRGTLVAADRDDKRLRALLGNVYRLAHPNVVALQADGRAFPQGARFDRVLVDAPCSAQGNLRRWDGELRDQDPSFLEHVTGVQEALLRRALELVRPGGDVLYVTCTFAPEENEAVVDAVLRDTPVTVEPIELDAPHSPGLVRFGDRRFDSRLERAWRLYPHHLDSGGLFMARLRRTDGVGAEEARGADAGAASPDGAEPGSGSGTSEPAPVSGDEPIGWSPVPPAFPGDTASPDEAAERIAGGVRGVRDRFGVAGETLDALGWMVRGNSVWAHGCRGWPLPAWGEEDGWRLLSVGLRALKEDPRTPAGERPTNDFLRYLGGAVGRSVVELEPATVRDVLDRVPRDVPEEDDGFVALRYRGRILGRGWIKRGVLRNEISKARSRRLIEFLEAGPSEAGAGVPAS